MGGRVVALRLRARLDWFEETQMPRSKSSRLTAKLKAKKQKERLRKAGRLSKRRAGGRLKKVARKA
jgi:hypothetical protein